MKFFSGNKFTIAALALCFSASVVIFLISIKQTQRVKNTSAEIVHTNNLLISIDKVIMAGADMQNATRGFIITGDYDMLDQAQLDAEAFAKNLQMLRQNPDTIFYKTQLDSLHVLVNKRIKVTNQIIDLYKQGNKEAAVAIVASGKGNIYTQSIRETGNDLKNQVFTRQNIIKNKNEAAIVNLNFILYSVLLVVGVLSTLLFLKVRKIVKQLVKEEEKFKALLNSTPDPLLIIDAAGIIKHINKCAEEITGYTAAEMIGMPISELFSETNNITVQTVEGLTEILLFTKAKTKIPVEVSYSPITTGKERFVAAALRDLTQRIESKKQIENLYKQINFAAEAIYVVDTNLIIQTWNHGAELMYGYTYEEVIGKNVMELLQPKISEEQIKGILNHLNEHNNWYGDIQRSKKNGKHVTVHTAISTVKNDDGNTTGYISVSHDITESIKLKQQINYLASITEQSSDAIFSRDLNKKLISWNIGAQKMFGYTKEEVLGKTANELGIIHFTQKEIAHIENELEVHGSWQAEKEYFHKDGSSLFGAVTANAIKNEDGELSSLVFLIKNITTQKRQTEKLKANNEELERLVKERTLDIRLSEKKYRLLFQNSPMPMFVLELEKLKFLDVNNMALHKYGYTREDFLALSPIDMRPEEDKEAFLTAKRPKNLTEKESNRGVWRHLLKDGSIIFVEIIAHEIEFEGKKCWLILSNDITEKKKAQEALIAREKRFKAMLENNNDIIVLISSDFEIVYRSPSAERVSGWTNEDTKNLSFLKDVVHPLDKDAIIQIIQNAIANPEVSYGTSYRILHKDGHYIYVEGSLINMLKDADINALVFNFRDVTERKIAEDKLVVSEKKFRALIENGADIINLIDKSFKVVYRSPSAVRISGRTDEDVLGNNVLEWIHPDDIGILTDGISRLLVAPGSSEKCLFRFLHKNGHYIWLEGTATNLLHDSAVEAVVFNYQEATEKIEAEQKLKQSEERYRSTLDNMLEGVQIVGFDWKYKYVNNAVVKQSKCAKEDLIGFTLMEKYPGIEQTTLYKTFKKCFDERIPIQVENEFVYPDGNSSWFELSFQPVPEGVFVLSVDITERVQVTLALQQEKDKLATIAATSPGLIYSFKMTADGTFSFPYTSKAVEDIFGFRHSAIKDNVQAVINQSVEGDAEKILNSIYASAQQMTNWQLEFRYNHPVKGMIWLEGNSIPHKETDGSTIWHGIIIDITERKKTEEKITEQSAQIKTLSDNLPGVMIYQLAGNDYENRKFTYVSNEVTRLTGKTPEEVINDPFILYDIILEEDRERITTAEKYSFTTMSVFNEEVKCITSKGELRWLNIISAPRLTNNNNNNKIVWDGFHVDITERKKNETDLKNSLVEKKLLAERLTAILNTLPANIALLNEKGTIIDVNQSWIQFAVDNGWEGKNYGIGDNYINISKSVLMAGQNDGGIVGDGINGVLHKNILEFIHEYTCHSPTQKRWYRMIASPLLGDGNTGAVVMHIDVSEIKRLEDERIRQKTEEQKNITSAILQGQEKERNAIGKELHDNINQILAGINMLLVLISKRPERTDELLPVCIKNVALAITENRKIAHELVTPDAEAESLIEQIKRITENMFVKAGIHIAIDDKTFNESLLSKEKSLAVYRIIQEQSTNILKYSKATEVKFKLAVTQQKFNLKIADNGCGIDTEKITGGIGLKNIYSRVNVFNGAVKIVSSPGNGFILNVQIPL